MRHLRFLSVVAAALAAATLHAQRPQPRYDVLIKNGRIVDGTGAPWFRGDVAIAGDRLAAVGPLPGATAPLTIDATNLVVAPGFIDLLGQSEFNVLVDGRAASKILQGVTTEVTGEGSAIAPVNDRMIRGRAAIARALRRRAGLAYARRLLQTSRRAISYGDQRRDVRRRGRCAQLRHRQGRSPSDTG